jgi:D-inositol-3-phosphate glycosyltransferase
MIAAHSCPVGELGARDTGGMSVYIRELARELSRQGHSVDVFTRVHDPADPIIDDLGEGARLIHLKAGQEAQLNKLEVFGYLPEFTRNMESFRQSYGLKYDLIFSHYWMSGLVAQKLQPRWRVPHAVMFHTLGAVKNAIGIGESDPALRIAAEKELVDRCQCIIAPTERGRVELEQYYSAKRDKISVVPCGVNMTLFQPVDRETARRKIGLTGEKMLLFVGRLDPLKGLERLLEAVPYLSGYHRLKLFIIGGDASSRLEIGRLREKCAALGIEDKVDLVGTVKQEALPVWYSAADVCVVPSYYESFGLVPLESLACGAPVVAADIGDVKNIVRHRRAGFIVPTNSPENLAMGIMSVLDMPPRSLENALSIRAAVSNYSWEIVASGIADSFVAEMERWAVPVL